MDPFLNILNNAREIATQFYPAAKFLEFNRDLTLLGAPWIFTFQDADKNIIVKYIEGTGFVTPPETTIKRIGLRTIPLFIGVTDAMKKLDFTPTLQTLYWPLNPNVPEPLYVFYGPHDKVAFVNAYDGKVTYMKHAKPELPTELPTNIPAPALPVSPR